MSGIEYWLEGIVTEAIAALNRRDVAVDVGANTGTWTKPLSSVFERVYAFEPDTRASSLIEPAHNVEVIVAAVADSNSERTFYLREKHGHNSLLEHHPIGGESMCDVPAISEMIVPCVSLEDFLPQGADFVKIDTEGGELLALAGCRSSDAWGRTFFIVECHDTFDGVEAELKRLGKAVTHVPHPLDAHPGHCWAIGK